MDELVKRLREISEWSNIEWEDYSYDAKETMHEAADAIEELSAIREEQKAQIILMAAEDKPRWIPVTERLPKEDDGMVFVLMPDVFPYNSKQPFANCNQDRRIDMAHYSEHSKTWYFGDCCAVGGQEPIAWIHRSALPEPPKEE